MAGGANFEMTNYYVTRRESANIREQMPSLSILFSHSPKESKVPRENGREWTKEWSKVEKWVEREFHGRRERKDSASGRAESRSESR